MSDLIGEIDENGRAFRDAWGKEISANIAALASDSVFVASYRRITAVQALKVCPIFSAYKADSFAFMHESHNDILTSHVFASFGAWRSSLQSLRSAIENILGALYYEDHPVELRLWQAGGFRLSFSGAHAYFSKHPSLSGIPTSLTGVDAIQSEYATLSKAVHGSAASFRMTDGAAHILLWSTEKAKLGAWNTRHKKVVEALALLCVCLHADQLKGTAHPQTRAALVDAISDSKAKLLKKELKIHIAR